MTYHMLGGAAVLLAVAGAPSTVVLGQAVADVPIVVWASRAYVPVSVGGHGPFWMILDTGASQTVLDGNIAETVGVPIRSRRRVRGAGSGDLEVGRTDSLILSIGRASLSVPSAFVFATDSLLAPFSGRREPGILGDELFRRFTVELDFRNQRMRLWEPSEVLSTQGGAAIPMEVNGLPRARGALTTSDGRTLPLDLLVDLGAKLALHLTEEFGRRTGLLESLGPSVTLPLGVGVGGVTRYHWGRVREVVVGGVSQRESIIVLSAEGTLRSSDHDGLLGFTFLARDRLIIDYHRRQLVMFPGHSTVDSTSIDRSGIFLVAIADTLRTLSVHPRSPGASAGLDTGDVLLAIDERPLNAATLEWARAVLRDRRRTRRPRR